MVEHDRINNTLGKLGYYLGNHQCVCVSVSGGSDSDIVVHMIATYWREFLPKVHFVFVNTGLEYQATKDHLEYLERKYDITIDRIRGVPVPLAVKRYGVPVISKHHSQLIEAYSRDVPWAMRRINQTKETAGGYAFSEKQRVLAQFVKEHGIRISEKCCKVSKKNPIAQYQKTIGADLDITGERKLEGGKRAEAHTSCFESKGNRPYDKYMPLFFWNDETKQWYKEREGIVYSDCYEVWGFKRTGCVGCPFNSRVGAELEVIAQYEPKMYKACMGVFGDAYRLMDEFNIRKIKILEDKNASQED